MNAATHDSAPCASGFRVVNLDRFPHTLPGGVGEPHDAAIVLSTTETERNWFTGKEEPKRLWPEHGVGTLEGAHAFVRSLPSGGGSKP